MLVPRVPAKTNAVGKVETFDIAYQEVSPFMTSSGMSRTHMANLFVVGESVVLALMPILDDFVHNHGNWGAATLGIFGIGATLSIMGHNQNIGWAIAAIVLVDLFCWLANRWSSMVRTWAIYEKHFSYERIGPSITTTKQLVKSAQSPIISFFLAWGFAPGCLWLGIAAGACGLLFVLTTRRYRFYPEDNENG